MSTFFFCFSYSDLVPTSSSDLLAVATWCNFAQKERLSLRKIMKLFPPIATYFYIAYMISQIWPDSVLVKLLWSTEIQIIVRDCGVFYEEGIRIFTFHLCFRITLLTKSVWTVFRCFSVFVRPLHSNAKHINSWHKRFVSKEHQDTFCPVIKLNLLLDLFIGAGAIFWLTVPWWCIGAMHHRSKTLWWCITGPGEQVGFNPGTKDGAQRLPRAARIPPALQRWYQLGTERGEELCDVITPSMEVRTFLRVRQGGFMSRANRPGSFNFSGRPLLVWGWR